MTHTHRLRNGKRIPLSELEIQEILREEAQKATNKEMKQAALLEKKNKRAELSNRLGMSLDELAILIQP